MPTSYFILLLTQKNSLIQSRIKLTTYLAMLWGLLILRNSTTIRSLMTNQNKDQLELFYLANQISLSQSQLKGSTSYSCTWAHCGFYFYNLELRNMCSHSQFESFFCRTDWSVLRQMLNKLSVPDWDWCTCGLWGNSWTPTVCLYTYTFAVLFSLALVFLFVLSDFEF